ncbi:ABC transporter substrate binding protein [Bradyrhizobium sp. B117]|uniref:ABC transporter substrate binding protein n=1 Tax=Bradyrhizobium sp. B117 TaxID=3140246 RepID=UPI0031844CAD
MNRREIIGILCAVAASPTRVALAREERGLRRIGILMFYSEDDPLGRARFKIFEQALAILGWVDGKNVLIDVRWGGADAGRTAQLAKELVILRPDVIVTTSTPTTAAVKRETQAIPIVFTVVSDPIGEGFVQSLARPDSNMTGFVNFEASLAGKWLSLLKEIDRRVQEWQVFLTPMRHLMAARSLLARSKTPPAALQ